MDSGICGFEIVFLTGDAMRKFLAAVVCVAVCFAGGAAQNIGDGFPVRGEVMQALAEGKAALVETQDYKIIYVESTKGELFYDGKKINKTGIFSGVYTYETINKREKIVPKVIF